LHRFADTDVIDAAALVTWSQPFEGLALWLISDRTVRCHLVRSTGPTRHTSGQHLAHDGAIDVLSGHDEADAASLHAGVFLDEGRERRCAGALRERVGIGEIDADRLALRSPRM
jgi:hypothetical protein